MQILLARQPVFDQREHLFGYDLVLRRAAARAGVAEPSPEQLVTDTFLGIGIDQVAAGRRAMVSIDRDMLLSGAVRLLPPERVVLQIDGKIAADSQLLETCDKLVWGGYCFAVESDHPEMVPEELLRLAEIVKVDVAATDTTMLSGLAGWLRSYQVRLLALHARHRAEREKCTKLGFELFEGYRFTAPETLIRKDLAISQAQAFRLFKLVRDPRTTDGEIEELMSKDVALTYKLLRMVNSASIGGRDIWSIGHAFRLLGRDRVARWLGLLLVTDGGRSGVRGELMHMSLVRARMCELLAAASGIPKARGPLFLVGMFSLLDQLLEIPMDSLADSMELASDIRLALVHREDFYGATLSLIEAYELGRWERVDTLSDAVGVGPVALTPLYLDALGWATEQTGRVDRLDTAA